MKYAKAVLAVVVAAAGALVTALGTGSTGDVSNIDTKHWIIAALTVLGSGAMVAALSNIPGIAGGIAKTAIAFLTAGLGSLVIALNDNHITQLEWVTAFMAAVIATGLVYETTNTGAVTSPTVATNARR
jgi:hypothetical protein